MHKRVQNSLSVFVTITAVCIGGHVACAQSPEVFAGSGKPSRSDGTSPTKSNRLTRHSGGAIALGNPFGIEIADNDVWITTVDDQCIWKTSFNSNEIVRVVGSGKKGYSGDGGPALEAQFNWPHEVRVDGNGNLFVADTRNHVIRRVDSGTRIVTTLAGNGKPGFAGDGNRGNKVQFDQPHSVVLDGDGGLLVADTKNHRLRRIDLETGIVNTVCGNGKRKLPVDGESIDEVSLFGPRSLAVDGNSIWIALREGNSIWRIDRVENRIFRIAGTGKKGYTGDGGDPLKATFSGPKGIAVDGQGNLLIVDTENHAVRRIDLEERTIETVLGGTKAKETLPTKRPHGIAPFGEQGFLLGDSEFHRVIKWLATARN